VTVPIRIGPDESGTVVTVARGDLIDIVLPENAGTGYEWQLDPLPAGLELVNDRNEWPASGMAGASGRRTFTVRAKDSGALSARLRRVWEAPERASQTFTVQLQARA
jgi:predicted secreted protein